MNTTSASLLERLFSDPEESPSAWKRLEAVYSPLIRGWLRRHGIRPDDADDLTQEVLVVVIRRFPEFRHNHRTGAFRTWLRAITVNCCRDFWKANRLRPVNAGGSDFGGYLDQIADPDNPLTAEWDREHDLFVTRQLLDLIRPEFETKTWEAFRRVALVGESASSVAAALGLSTNAVFIAKSRVLARLREEANGLVS